MEQKVSVIVPIYNVQNYLDKCVQSIINQTYTNLEIILVDDGSPDECGITCDQYADKDSRIKVIHKKNGGLSEARNQGMACATGKYITFVDADDFIHRRYVEILMDVAMRKHADIVVGDFELFHNAECCKDKSIDEVDILQSQVLTSKCLYDKEFIRTKRMILTVAWGKLYERKLWEGIVYPVGKIHEDTFTTYKLMERAYKIVYLQQPVYYWRENVNSITRGKFTLSHLDDIEAFGEQLEYYYNTGKKRHVEIVLGSYFESFFWCYNRMIEEHVDLSELKKFLENMKKYIWYAKPTKSLGLWQWLKYRYLVYYKIPKLIR